MADPLKPLAPLDPSQIAHLGDPAPWTLPRQGDRDIQFSGWVIGKGEIAADGTDPATATRGTTVEILLTKTGRLVTSRTSWTRTDDVCTDSQRSQFHETADAAYRWLIKDGNGKLGPASKIAWTQACRALPALAGFDVEQI
jgi:hypothetical protein